MDKGKELLSEINDRRARVGLPPIFGLGERPEGAAPKLSFREKCEILAFVVCGVPDKTIASVFGVSSQTVFLIKQAAASVKPKHYKDVVAEFMDYNNPAAFCGKYITELREREIKEMFPNYLRPE